MSHLPIRIVQVLCFFAVLVSCTKEKSSVSLASQLANLDLEAVVTLSPEPDPTSAPDPTAVCPALAYASYGVTVLVPRVGRCPMMNEIDLVVTRNGSPIKDAILESDDFPGAKETGECSYSFYDYYYRSATYSAKVSSSVLPLPAVTLPAMPTKTSSCSIKAGSVEVHYAPKGAKELQ